MLPINKHKGVVIPLDRSNVDTDAIIPKQFLKSIKKSGFGPNLFDEWRYLDHGEPGQDISAGFITIISSANLQIQSIESELIKKIEVHTMKMESDGYGGKIMKMRKIKSPQIIANKPFILKPGADHLMFFGMGESITKGKEIPLKFNFLDKQKMIEKTIIFSVI